LAILTSRRAGRRLDQQLLVVALALTGLWSLRHALGGALIAEMLSDGIGETMRNGAWLAVIWAYLREAAGGRGARVGRPLVLAALTLLLAAQIAFDLLVGEQARLDKTLLPLVQGSWLLR